MIHNEIVQKSTMLETLIKENQTLQREKDKFEKRAEILHQVQSNSILNNRKNFSRYT